MVLMMNFMWLSGQKSTERGLLEYVPFFVQAKTLEHEKLGNKLGFLGETYRVAGVSNKCSIFSTEYRQHC